MTIAQEPSSVDKVLSLPDKLFGALDKKTASIEGKLKGKTEQYLATLQRREEKLKRKLWKRDSSLAKEVFGDVQARYDELRKLASDTSSTANTPYWGRLDSLQTSLRFLGTQNPQLSSDPRLQATLAKYNNLQQNLRASEIIRKQLKQRETQLRSQFEKLGMVRELKAFRKEVYYYGAQLKEYKALFEDPSKWEAKLIELAMKLPQFKAFFANNSQLGSLFALPGRSSGIDPTAALTGLQTRASIEALLQNRFGSGASTTQLLQQRVGEATGSLSSLRSRAASLQSGSRGNGDPSMPDFKPNGQKTKSFLKRLEFGTNIQSQRARYFFPTTTDLGLSVGYKLNDNGVLGIGASYKLGWGRGWEKISITHQGMGVRSFIDWKIKGAFYLSGGYEGNYRQLIQSVDALRDRSAWQMSGLLGLSKRYKVGKAKGEMKLLWDFLSYQQVPRSQPIVFRIGYQLR